MCPAGTGDSTMAMVTDAGGTVTLSGTPSTTKSGVPLRLEIPRGALATPTIVTITETEIPPPVGYVDGSPIYRIDPADLAFAKPAILTIPFQVLSGVNGPALAIYQIIGDQFMKVPDSYLNAGFLQGSIKSGGLYFAGVPKSPTQEHCP
jgi:hypothetical protein